MTLSQKFFNPTVAYSSEQPLTSPPQKSLKDIFNTFAASAVHDFAKLRGSFMLIDGQTGAAIGDVDLNKMAISPEDLAMILAQQQLREQPGGGYADTMLITPETPFMDRNRRRFSAVKEGEVYTIRFNQGVNISGDFEKDTVFALEHELGHAVVPGAMSPTNINYDESAADVFAGLKYIQRHGDDGFLTLVARWRAENMLMGDAGHYTSRALLALGDALKTLDVKNMTPEQMASKAQEIATKTQLDSKTTSELQGLQQKTASVLYRTGIRDATPGEFLKVLAFQLCAQNVYASEFKTGMSILKPFLQDVPGYPVPRELQGSEWEMLKRNLLNKEATVQPAPAAPVQAGPALRPLPKAFDEAYQRPQPQQPRQPQAPQRERAWSEQEQSPPPRRRAPWIIFSPSGWGI